MDKSKLRKQLIKARLDLDGDEYTTKSNFIINNLKKHPYYLNAKTIGIYVSFNHEVETHNLIKEMFSTKRVCVPKIIGKDMSFYQINSLEELEVSKFGILEPVNNCLIEKNEIDLLIIPLVGYDNNHNRLGYGGGYYDRYLSGYKGKSIALAFSCQEVKNLPVEPFDLPIEIILNEI